MQSRSRIVGSSAAPTFSECLPLRLVGVLVEVRVESVPLDGPLGSFPPVRVGGVLEAEQDVGLLDEVKVCVGLDQVSDVVNRLGVLDLDDVGSQVALVEEDNEEGRQDPQGSEKVERSRLAS